MEKFGYKRRGYDPKEVDEYIDRLERRYNDTLNEQTARIDSLKEECASYKKRLDEYKSKESDVNKALLTAIEKAKEMDYTAKIRFALEGERIKIFQAKWIRYCDKKRDDLRIQGDKISVCDFLAEREKEIEKFLEQDLNITREKVFNDAEQDYLSERLRNSQFNLDDINDPPDLRSICEEIES